MICHLNFGLIILRLEKVNKNFKILIDAYQWLYTSNEMANKITGHKE